jgi:DNA mismatch endonuclease (patch repair protein)
MKPFRKWPRQGKGCLLLGDIVSPAVRSRMMAGIRTADTKPEMVIRRALHARGYRYRLHVRSLPGTPDLAFPSRRAVIFVHGCFWHGHDCHLFRLPSTRTEFWRAKINRNRENDKSSIERLSGAGWRSCTIWECALKGRNKIPVDQLADRVCHWLSGGAERFDLSGS